MKSAMTSIQPYYVFLIIARFMGWDIPQNKTVEVRKNYPKAADWDRKAIIYCSNNRKSFNRIPKEYQPLMRQFLGKVVGEFVCDDIDFHLFYCPSASAEKLYKELLTNSCLTLYELWRYSEGKFYAWHISDLKIYEVPKALGEFCKPCDWGYDCCTCKRAIYELTKAESKVFYGCDRELTRPFQSWGYVEAYVTN